MSDNLLLPLITIGLSGLITISGTIFNYYLSQRSKALDESRKRQEAAERLAERYAKPLLAAADELKGRFESILVEDWLGRQALWPDWQPDPEQPPITYDYYLKSTLYLIGQFFAWIDIMRREEILLPLSNREINRQFQILLDNCIKAFADSRIAPGIAIFRQQQRAIGQQLVEANDVDKTLRCIVYSTFVENYEQKERYRRWFEPAEALVLKIKREGDPRLIRLQVVVAQLENFINFVNTKMGIQFAEEYNTQLVTQAAPMKN